MARKTSAGFTVLEMFVALAMFSVILVVTTMLLQQSVAVWTTGDSREDASLVVHKARSSLNRDLLRADIDLSPAGEPHLDQVKMANVLGGQDALWFLSAAGPNGEFYRDPDGYPFWQRNILYFLVIPGKHNQLYGTDCQLGSNPNGDDQCAHKMLIRMVIDNPPATAPPPPPPNQLPAGAEPEKLIPDTDITDYLLAPQGFDVNSLQALPGVEEVKIVATEMLWFKVSPAPAAPTAGLQIDMRAVALREAAKEMPLGSVPLLDAPTTLQSTFSILPNN